MSARTGTDRGGFTRAVTLPPHIRGNRILKQIKNLGLSNFACPVKKTETAGISLRRMSGPRLLTTHVSLRRGARGGGLAGVDSQKDLVLLC